MPQPIGTKCIEVVDGMDSTEVNLVMGYANINFKEWATFTFAKRKDKDVKPGFVAGFTISYTTLIRFHDFQAVELNAYLRGFLAGVRSHEFPPDTK